MTIVYDATAPGVEEFVLGPGNPRVAHAYPDGSNVALCGHAGSKQPTSAKHCLECEHASGQKHWVTR